MRDIRLKSSTTKKIKISFCPSNVPDLDDERGILKSQLEKAYSKLHYEKNAAILHHYASLDILRQILFVSERPDSRLSKEYEELVTSLIAGNPADREGALISLKSLLADMSTLRSAGDSEKAMDAFDNIGLISSHHHNDPEVAFYLGRVYSVLGSVDEELDSLNVAIEGTFSEDKSRVRRARLYQAMGRNDDAAEDLLTVLRSEDADPYQIAPALSALRVARSELVAAAVEGAPALERADIDTLRRVSQVIRGVPGGREAAKKIFTQGVARFSDPEDLHSARAELVLFEISLGQFSDAINTMGRNREEVLTSVDIARNFNFAMAEWGLKGEPPVDLFQESLSWRWPGFNSTQISINALLCQNTCAAIEMAETSNWGAPDGPWAAAPHGCSVAGSIMR